MIGKKIISNVNATCGGIFRRKICIVAVFLSCFCLYSNNIYPQRMAVATNLLGYLNFGTLNAQLEYGITQHFSIYIQGKYNPFEYEYNEGEKQINNKQAALSLGGRYWLWHNNSGWYFSGQMNFVNFNRGGIVSQDTYEGDAYGITLGAGYALMISKRINMDFGAGFMGGVADYVKYACPSCGRILDKDKKLFMSPNNVMVQLSYLF